MTGKTEKRDAIVQRIEWYLNTKIVEGSSTIILEPEKQLNEYFNGIRKAFDLPLFMVGTDFQKSVWYSLLQIPFGKTASYLELSKKLGNEKAIRAIASANSANAISIIIPCHRIIDSNGDLVGYAGGLSAKKKLLILEGLLNSNQLSIL